MSIETELLAPSRKIGWHVGVTASRSTRPNLQIMQADRLFLWLFKHGYTEWHGGDCIGGDTQLWQLATQYFHTIGHPPLEVGQRAFLTYAETRGPQSYLDRNRALVDEIHYLVALPDGAERTRSGTWSTVRYARKKKIAGCVIYPDGRTELL